MIGLAILLTATIATPQAPPRDAAPQAGTGTIRGRVVAAGTNRPLPKVDVRASSPALKQPRAVLSGADGRFELSGLPPGRYTVNAFKPNFVRANYGQRRALGAGAAIEVESGQVVAGIDFTLHRTGVIAGRIVDEFGEPVVGAPVVPQRYFYVNGERRLQQAGSSVSTNDLGEYRIFGLSPGRYIVSASMRDTMIDTATANRPAYTPTYYPAATTSAAAQPLTIAEGTTLSGMDIALLRTVAGTITGTVREANGRPAINGYVAVSQAASTVSVGGGGIRENGVFTVPRAPPGRYILRATWPEAESATAEVTVEPGSTSTVDMAAMPPSTIRGRFVAPAGASPPPAADLRFSLLYKTLVPNSPMVAVATAKTDWTFELKARPGDAAVRVSAPGDWQAARILSGGVDVSDAGLAVAPGAVADVIVELTTRRNEISGTVNDADGHAVRDCIVVLFAQDAQKWVPFSRYVAAGRPDTSNLYRVRIPHGEYFIVAFEEPDFSGAWADRDVLAQLREHATPISIGAGEKKTVDLVLSPPPVY